MTQLSVDLEKMANTLQKSLNKGDPFRRYGERLQLRMRHCGLASVAVSEFLKDEGYVTRLKISNPGLIRQPRMKHVVAEVDTADEALWVDATFGQFMGLVGVGLLGMHVQYYPNERIIAFPANHPEVPVDILIRSTEAFRAAIERGETAPIPSAFDAPLVEAPVGELREEFGKIWDEAHFTDFTPDVDTYDAGRWLADRMHKHHVA